MDLRHGTAYIRLSKLRFPQDTKVREVILLKPVFKRLPIPIRKAIHGFQANVISVLPLCHMGILLVWFSKIAIQDFFVAICIWSCQHLTLVYTNEQQKKAEKTTMF